MKLFLLFFIFNNPLFAVECTDCSTELKPFDNIIKNIEVLQAPTVINCNDVLRENAKKEYDDNFAKLPKSKNNIRGINLEGSLLELKYLNKMLGQTPNDEWKLAKDCKNVLCVLTKMYNSEETAQRVLNIAKRDGYIVSLAKDFNNEKDKPVGQLFSPAEIRDIDLAYKLLPSSYKKLSSLDLLKRLPKGYLSPHGDNVAAYASPSFHSTYYNKEGEITFIDGAFNSDKSWGPLVAVHELSHHVDYSYSQSKTLGISEGNEYLKLSGWFKKKAYKVDETSGKKILVDDWQHAPDKKFITEYASSQPAEDFAETCAYYIFEPKKLKSVDPDKYNFVKNIVFKGKEFINDVAVHDSKSDILKACLNNNKEYRMYGVNNRFSTKIDSYCLDDYFKKFIITDPSQCAYNIQQIKNIINDEITPQTEYLNQVLSNFDSALQQLSKDCISENDYQNQCPIKKYFDNNILDSQKLNLTPDETAELQANLSSKISYTKLRYINHEILLSVVEKQGKNNFISDVLINGLAEKDKVSDDYPLTRQKYFLDNATAALEKKLNSDGYKFDKTQEIKELSQSYIMMDNDISTAIKSFQEIVFKFASRSKNKNLELIKAWAASQGIQETPKFDDLAESLRKYGSIWR